MIKQLSKSKRRVRDLKNELASRGEAAAAMAAEKKAESRTMTADDEARTKLRSKCKKLSAENRRKDVSMKDLLKKYHAEVERREKLTKTLKTVKERLSHESKSHEQRRSAIGALREGVGAQRQRVEALQAKIQDQSKLEHRARQAEHERSRLSSELQESHGRFRRAEKARHALEEQVGAADDRVRDVEAKAHKAVEDAERRASLASHRAKVGKSAMTEAVVAVAEALVDEIGRCRVRLRSVRRSVSVKKKNPGGDGHGDLRGDLNDSEATDDSVESQQRNAAVEAETITNVSAMLDMSAGEVAEVLGLSPTPGAKYAAAAAEAAGLVPRGDKSPGRPRAQHTMAVARLRLALQSDPPDKKVILAVVESLVVERSKLESAVAKAHLQHMNDRAEAQVTKLREDMDTRAQRHAREKQKWQLQQQQQQQQQYASSFSSVPSSVSPISRGGSDEGDGSGAGTITNLVALEHMAPGNVAVLVGEIKAQMQREHNAAASELLHFQGRVAELERQLQSTRGASGTNKRKSDAVDERNLLEEEGHATGSSVKVGRYGGTSSASTAIVRADEARMSGQNSDSKALRPTKRAALEERLKQLQEDATDTPAKAAMLAAELANAVFGPTSTPQRATNVPVPYGSSVTASAGQSEVVVQEERDLLQSEFQTAATAAGDDSATSQRRGTYFGLCE